MVCGGGTFVLSIPTIKQSSGSPTSTAFPMIHPENLLQADLFQHPLIPAYLNAVRACILYRNMTHAAVKRSFADETKPVLEHFFSLCETADDEELTDAICRQVWIAYQIIDSTALLPDEPLDENILVLDRKAPFLEWIDSNIPWLLDSIQTDSPLLYERIWTDYPNGLHPEQDENTRRSYNFRFLLLLHLFNLRADNSLQLFTVKHFQEMHQWLLDTYLQIIYDQKSFDAVRLIYDQLFYENFEPRPTYARRNVHMMLLTARCYSYLPEKENATLILTQLFRVLDEERPIPAFPRLPEDDRKELIQEMESPKTNWTYSSIQQVENVFRLALIDTEKYNKTIHRLKKNQLPPLLPNSILYPFRLLSIEKKFPFVDEPICAPQVLYLADATTENLIEYQQAFYHNQSTNGVRKYFSLRQELWKDELLLTEDFSLLTIMQAEIKLLRDELQLKAIADLSYAERLLTQGESSFRKRLLLVNRMQLKLNNLGEEEIITICEGLLERRFRHADSNNKRYLFDCTGVLSLNKLEAYF
jgi:hypothetical protein